VDEKFTLSSVFFSVAKGRSINGSRNTLNN